MRLATIFMALFFIALHVSAQAQKQTERWPEQLWPRNYDPMGELDLKTPLLPHPFQGNNSFVVNKLKRNKTDSHKLLDSVYYYHSKPYNPEEILTYKQIQTYDSELNIFSRVFYTKAGNYWFNTYKAEFIYESNGAYEIYHYNYVFDDFDDLSAYTGAYLSNQVSLANEEQTATNHPVQINLNAGADSLVVEDIISTEWFGILGEPSSFTYAISGMYEIKAPNQVVWHGNYYEGSTNFPDGLGVISFEAIEGFVDPITYEISFQADITLPESGYWFGRHQFTLTDQNEKIFKESASGHWMISSHERYNENGNNTTYTSYIINDNQEAIPRYHQIYTYDENYFWIGTELFNWSIDQNDWKSYWKATYEVNEHGHRTLRTVFEWDYESNAFIQTSHIRYEYEYDENGQTTYYSHATWSEEFGWTHIWKYEYTYNEDGNFVYQTYCNWNHQTADWQGVWVTNYEYNSNGKLLIQLISVYEFDELVNDTKIMFVYDEDQNLMHTTYHHWGYDSGWLANMRYQYTYDNNGYRTSFASLTMMEEENEFQYVYINNYLYDELGNLLLQSFANWRAEYDEWDPAWKNEFYYSYHDAASVLTTKGKSIVLLYPNPVSTNLHLEKLTTGSQISVFDLQGKLISRRIAANESLILPVQHLEKGVYIISIQDGSHLSNHKFIKK